MPEPTENQEQACIFVIFGGTGDLTKRKLIPALYNLIQQKALSQKFGIVCIGRQEKTEAAYKNELLEALRAYSKHKVDAARWDYFTQHLFYKQFDFSSAGEGYAALGDFLRGIDQSHQTAGNRIFYLAVAPEFFAHIIAQLKRHALVEEVPGCFRRIMIEKPFGTNLHSARELHDSISKSLSEKSIFRIDHYLGKEMIQNILSLRFGNSIFESMWNNHYIDNIQITATETIGVENRGNYFEKSGILKDMMQNHILQMLSLLAMEPPVSLDPECIRDEKVKVLRALRLFDAASARQDIVRGQYGRGLDKDQVLPGYREEERVSPTSETPTFMALKMYIDNFRWGGVPFYIRTGKRMDKRTTEIVVQFKKLPGIHFFDAFQDAGPNLLVIKVQPQEGLYFRINAKRPGTDFAIQHVDLDYCQSCQIGYNSLEAYERLILEAIRDNSSLFTRWDELEYSWSFTESIEQALKDIPAEFPNYAAGSGGPQEAHALLEKDGRRWWQSEELN